MVFFVSVLIAPIGASQAWLAADPPPLLGSAFPISSASQYQELPVVAYNATANEYLVVWQDARNGVTDYDIYAQRISATGTLLGENIPLTQGNSGQTSPVAVWNAIDNEYLVAWSDSWVPFDIYAQRISASGIPIGARLSVSTAADWQMLEALAWNATANEYLVVWRDYRNSSPIDRISDLYGQRLSANGMLLGSDFAISRAAESQSSADVIWNATADEYLVAWQDGRYGRGAAQIFVRRLKQDGALLGEEVAIPALSYSQGSPAIAWNPNVNEYMVAWTDDHYGFGPYNIFAQRVSASAVLLGASIAVTNIPFDHGAPSIVFNRSTDEYTIVWSDCRSSPPCGDVYAQRIAANGTLIDQEIAIAVGSNEQAAPYLAWNSQNNEFLVVWNEYRADSQKDIYGQRVSGFGPLVTSTPTGTATQTTTPTQTPTNTITPSVTPTGTPSSTPTDTLTPTVTPTGSVTPAFTPTQTGTATPSPTRTPTLTPSPTLSPTSTPTTKRDVYLPVVIHDPSPTPTPAPTSTSTSTPTSTPTETPTLEPTWTPTATPTFTATPTATTPPEPAGIYGRVTYKGNSASGIQLTLRWWNGAAWSSMAQTNTGVDGSYLFGSVPSLEGSQIFYVLYGPNTTDSHYLYVWSGPQIIAYLAGTRARGGDFDIANVNLLAPSSGSSVRLPATFTWQRRGLPGDTYLWYLFEPSGTYRWLTSDLGDVGSFSLTTLPAGASYNKQFAWTVYVYSGAEGYGISHTSHWVTFVQ